MINQTSKEMTDITSSSSEHNSSGQVKPQRLVTRVLYGTAWNIIGTVVRQIFVVASTIIIARLLLPEDYAIAGLAKTILGFIAILTLQGFAQALIQKPDLNSVTCHSVFWAMTISGILLGGLINLGAPWVAEFYHQPKLVWVIRVMSFGLIINIISAVPNALLQKNLLFKEINLVIIIGEFLSALAGVLLAWLGYGYWALILPLILASVITAFGAFWISRYQPALNFKWIELQSISRFGFSMLGTNLTGYINENSDYLIMGRFWKPIDFGLYFFAFEYSRRPFNILFGQFNTVLFPAFSQIQDNLVRLKKAFLQGTRAFCIFIIPVHVLIIGMADPLIPLLFGDQWKPAILIFQIFASFIFLRSLTALVSPALLSINKADIALKFNLLRILFILPGLFLLGYFNASIYTTAVVLVIIWHVIGPFYLVLLCRLIDLHWSEIWQQWGEIICASVFMAITWLICQFLLFTIFPYWLSKLILCPLISAIVYLLIAKKSIQTTILEIRNATKKG